MAKALSDPRATRRIPPLNSLASFDAMRARSTAVSQPGLGEQYLHLHDLKPRRLFPIPRASAYHRGASQARDRGLSGGGGRGPRGRREVIRVRLTCKVFQCLGLGSWGATQAGRRFSHWHRSPQESACKGSSFRRRLTSSPCAARYLSMRREEVNASKRAARPVHRCCSFSSRCSDTSLAHASRHQNWSRRNGEGRQRPVRTNRTAPPEGVRR